MTLKFSITKRIFSYLFFSFCFGLIALSQNIAVYVVSDSNTPDSYAKVVSSAVTSAINSDGHFVAVERTNDFLNALSAESNYNLSGAVSEYQIIQLGRQYGAQYVFVVDLSDILGELYASSRIINIENNVVEAASDSYSRISNISDLRNISQDIAVETLNKLPYNQERQRREYENNERQRLENYLAAFREVGIYSISDLNYAYKRNICGKDEIRKIIDARNSLGISVNYPIIYSMTYYDKRETKTHTFLRVLCKYINSNGTTGERVVSITHTKSGLLDSNLSDHLPQNLYYFIRN